MPYETTDGRKTTIFLHFMSVSDTVLHTYKFDIASKSTINVQRKHAGTKYI
jgi:hypothetical protein